MRGVFYGGPRLSQKSPPLSPLRGEKRGGGDIAGLMRDKGGKGGGRNQRDRAFSRREPSPERPAHGGIPGQWRMQA